MSRFLGIDTSNYTTSAAIYDDETNQIEQQRKLLPVREGQLGLRQSDAVFEQVRQLPQIIGALPAGLPFSGIGYSATPRTEEGSYMPCFLVGQTLAVSLGHLMNLPAFSFSHQQGHIMAGLYSADAMQLCEKDFLAIHISGGTTDAVLIHGGEGELHTRLVGGSLDLKAGQLIDRVGLMLGLRFPAGPALEQLALQSEKTTFPVLRPSIRQLGCNLSGGYNLCEKYFQTSGSKEETARYCLAFLTESLSGLLLALRRELGCLPCLFVGGVASDSIIREELLARHDQLYFASPTLSSDNAAGIALLAARRWKIQQNQC